MFKDRFRFNRQELAGAFGDLGTDFPLLVGLITICKLDTASVLILFGTMQILTGLLYGLPMPVQPLKAMAVLMITQKLSGELLYGAGLAIGIGMLFLSLSNLLGWLARVVPLCVVRGIQLGLGLNLALLALKEYVPAEGTPGYWLAGVAFLLTLLLLGNRRFPAALIVVLIGFGYAALWKLQPASLLQGVGFHLPKWHLPSWRSIWEGFLILALPQLPLSISNSILATHQTLKDLYPQRAIGIRQIGFTYALMNLVNPFFGGVPTCHGAGGLAGYYTFGARTGGAVLIYGSLYLLIGILFSAAFGEVLKIFPLPVLGVILLFEGLTMMGFIREVGSAEEFRITLLVGLLAVGLPYGYLIGLLVGWLLVGFQKWLHLTRGRSDSLKESGGKEALEMAKRPPL